jgi:hypothetical protein
MRTASGSSQAINDSPKAGTSTATLLPPVAPVGDSSPGKVGSGEHLSGLPGGQLPDGPGLPDPCGLGDGFGVARRWPQMGCP